MNSLLPLLSLGVVAAAQTPTTPTPAQTPTPAPAAAQTPYSLKYTPTEGLATTYKMTGSMDIQGGTSSMEAKVVEKIIKVDPDGTYSMQVDTLEGKVVFSGQELPMPKNTALLVYKPTGEVVSATGDQLDQSSLRSQNLTMLKRPDHPVNPGDSWVVSQKADPAAKQPGLDGRFTFDGVEAVGKYQALKIESKMSETDIPNAGSVTATFWVSKDDGSVIKYDIHYRDMTFPGVSSPLSGTLGMIRVDS